MLCCYYYISITIWEWAINRFTGNDSQEARRPRRPQNCSRARAENVSQLFGLAFRLPEKRSALKALRKFNLHLQLRRRRIRRRKLLSPS